MFLWKDAGGSLRIYDHVIVFLISEISVMFWSGKKKDKASSERNEDPRTIVAKALADLLGVQMALAPVGEFEVSRIEVKRGHINRKAIGYIYGFIDGALQCRGEDIANGDLGPPILYSVLQTLFPGHERAYMAFLMEHEDDELVMIGKMAGGQQFFEFHKQQERGGTFAPMGFSRFIVGRED